MMTHSRIARTILASLGIATLAACGGSATDPTPQQSATVKATPSERFDPGSVLLVQGGTVTFDFGSLAHNVYFDNAPQGAPANITAPTSNTTVALTFNTAGTYPYNCHLHPGMKGTITVR